jgi:hypothetical protein
MRIKAGGKAPNPRAVAASQGRAGGRGSDGPTALGPDSVRRRNLPSSGPGSLSYNEPTRGSYGPPGRTSVNALQADKAKQKALAAGDSRAALKADKAKQAILKEVASGGRSPTRRVQDDNSLPYRPQPKKLGRQLSVQAKRK